MFIYRGLLQNGVLRWRMMKTTSYISSLRAFWYFICAQLYVVFLKTTNHILHTSPY